MRVSFYKYMSDIKSAQNIESDAFDRELFDSLSLESQALTELIKSGSNLLPHFDSLILDLFCAFYKHNVLFLPEDHTKKGSSLARKLLNKIFHDSHYKELREETVLEGFKSALATEDMGNQLLSWLRSDDGPGERKLLKEWEVDEAEDRVAELKEEMETWDEVEQENDEMAEAFNQAKEEKQSELDEEEANLDQLIQNQEDNHENMDFDMDKMVKTSLEQANQNIEETEDQIQSWDSSMGNPEGGKGAGEKLDLAAKLSKNDKLKKLSLLVGSLKDEMLSARRKVWSKRGSEVFDVSIGDDIGRMIPTELVSLRHKLLKHDFKKRYVEGRLFQYYLKEERGRGPMVICLDGSSSMDGNKELWSKGVCLTLLDIAKRERRKFNVVVFSSGGAPLKIFESIGKEGLSGWGMKESDIIELAEYFPGGGTNFEEPLTKALELLEESKFKGGDIVFITDGESNVGDMFLKTFKETQDKLRFKVYSVLIDLSERESWGTLSRFSDKVTSVSKLTSKEAKGLFLDL
ncbi:MAG: VWA domain-containing protein [Thermodesulfobacteriota bacterium]|nr:MAG: VWA domain-containing protein [Thermodesulfobacteriota bacterium]